MPKNEKFEQRQPLQEGQEFPLTIKRIGINGEGIGYFKRQAVFVEGALPGEVIVGQVEEVKRNRAIASIKYIREASPSRQKAPCPVYKICGGCQLQHAEYGEQLWMKQDLVLQSFERYAPTVPEVRETIGMENPWRYRNKSQWQTGEGKKGRVEAGLYSSDSNQLVDLTNVGCMVEKSILNKITKAITVFMKNEEVPVHTSNQKGVKTIVVRANEQKSEVQVTLVTSSVDLPEQEELVDFLRSSFAEIKSIHHHVQNESSPTVFGGTTKRLWGKDTIKYNMQDFSFHLSPEAFFQLNSEQASTLYDEAKKAAKLTGREKVVDAYCGSGTIGLWMSPDAREVRGMDMIKASIQDANKNAKQAGASHARFYHGKAEEMMLQWQKENWRPDVIVADPPRTGCGEALLNTIGKVKPKRFVYVSCNPSTLAKDAAYLKKAGYHPEYAQPVDMFPQTSQVEAVVPFVYKPEKKGKK
ncbi:23S rRNA (uracil(1939)-C(5))-methyltransferase RlmD [Marinococcus halophilus]|uniref:23S rRNA (uracil(1939)-C(5))-methyltransferase RlmD n=1 Tax=Marinococcus halophilus TaxID=1371 RepID=UPI001FD52B59|nr:23S rRNA (uracil(1939)-C(5))-methyltransferase RlmD [Marinococcus halophilus]